MIYKVITHDDGQTSIISESGDVSLSIIKDGEGSQVVVEINQEEFENYQVELVKNDNEDTKEELKVS